MEALFRKCSKKVLSGTCLRCWLKQTVNAPGTVELSRQAFKGETSHAKILYGLMLPKAMVEFGSLSAEF